LYEFIVIINDVGIYTTLFVRIKCINEYDNVYYTSYENVS